MQVLQKRAQVEKGVPAVLRMALLKQLLVYGFNVEQAQPIVAWLEQEDVFCLQDLKGVQRDGAGVWTRFTRVTLAGGPPVERIPGASDMEPESLRKLDVVHTHA